MTPITRIIRGTPGRARHVISTLLVAVAAVALVWLGHASAEKGGPSPAAISKEVSNVPTGKADAVDATIVGCTLSPQFNDMPDMAKSFKLGGTAAQPVIVLFQGEWTSFMPGSGVLIQLAIDQFAQSAQINLAFRPSGEPDLVETHGFNFISDALAPGTHTAKILWKSNGAGQVCVRGRTMIVLHK